jgi:hypothetical protein
MTLRNYQDAQDLVRTSHLDFETLIMAVCQIGYADKIKPTFPDLYEDWAYRHWSGGGLRPGEPGYNRDTDDNLPGRGKS